MNKFILTTIACTALISFSPLGDQNEVNASTPVNDTTNTQIKNLQVSPPAAVNEIFPDDALSYKIAQKLGVSEDTVVTQDQLNTITELVYVDFGVEDLTGMEYLSNLNTLNLSQNNISNLDSLANLSNLEVLSLNSNKITNLTALMNLPKLNDLELGINQISTLPSFENLTNLEILNLSSNQLDDISELKTAPGLTNLSVSSNNITDISVVSELDQLQVFYCDYNEITSLEGFRDNTTLTDLSASFNKIMDITPLSSIPTLRSLTIEVNQISDFSSLENQLLTTFDATGQEVYLPSVALGESTDIVIKDNKGATLTDWVWHTPGTYENNTLIWENAGNNSAYFVNNVYPEFPSVTVDVYQTVTPN